MSAGANPYQKGWTETFTDPLEREMLQSGCFIDETDARADLFASSNPTKTLAVDTALWIIRLDQDEAASTSLS